MHRTKRVATTLLFLGVTGLLYAGTLRERFEESYKLLNGSELILSNTNGSVTIESWDREEIRIEAEKTVKAGDRELARRLMDEIKIEVEHDEDRIEIDTWIPKKRSGLGWFGDDFSVGVQYTLMVPSRLNMDVQTVNGAVDISAVSGKIYAKSTNGRIEIRRARGSLRAKTTNGSIDVELLEVEANEDMTFETTNGAIEAYFPRDFKANIDAKTTNGSIKTDFPIEVRGEISRRRLRGDINGGGGRLTLRTTNGSIRIKER